MILARVGDKMKKSEYEELRDARDKLSGLLLKARLPQHKLALHNELVNIRTKIKNAHRELNGSKPSKTTYAAD